ncbi:hypothetical protein EC973_006589 [Apophysomyces ossiformis]|uniref:Uncharacterized protein n=1 Tax=Apophysomyces ossiformis TaxID=679940 RepID=A0A8H7EUJ3_9FUNG|nr:hypothetical protein EC973_006589 [Apophysomyces ossiformis]
MKPVAEPVEPWMRCNLKLENTFRKCEEQQQVGELMAGDNRLVASIEQKTSHPQLKLPSADQVRASGRPPKVGRKTVLPEDCPICGLVQSQEHLLWPWPCKQPFWQRLVNLFLVSPSHLTSASIFTVDPQPLVMQEYASIDFLTFLACVRSTIWRSYWALVFDNTPFHPAQVINKAVLLLRRLKAENKCIH